MLVKALFRRGITRCDLIGAGVQISIGREDKKGDERLAMHALYVVGACHCKHHSRARKVTDTDLACSKKKCRSPWRQ
jgi:hypothetical protein